MEPVRCSDDRPDAARVKCPEDIGRESWVREWPESVVELKMNSPQGLGEEALTEGGKD